MADPIVASAVPDNRREDKLAGIAPGQDVYDRLGKKVGQVDTFYAGSTGNERRAATPPTVLPAPVMPTGQQTVPVMEPVVPVTIANPVTVPEFDTSLHWDDNFPKELRERLAHDGFIKIAAGLLHHSRYALRDQIKRVEGDRVTLNVEEHELIKH